MGGIPREDGRVELGRSHGGRDGSGIGGRGTLGRMAKMSTPTLSLAEWRAVEHIVTALEERLGNGLSVWLYGSRARGEAPHSESDVDVLVVAEGADDLYLTPELTRIVWTAGDAEGVSPIFLDVTLRTPEWIAGRREIRSFFIQEVDRDKIVLRGAP